MKKSIFMLLAAAAFVSCSDNNAVEPNVNAGDAMIQLRSVHKTLNAGSAETRAPYMGTISASNPLEARVISVQGLTDGTGNTDYATNLHTVGKMTFIGGSNVSAYDVATIDAAKANFPSADDKLYLFGLYPYDGWGTLTATNIPFTFNGSQDVMRAPEVETSQEDVKDNTIATLAFEHMLTKLEVSVVAESTAAKGIWGNVTKIELIQANEAAMPNVATVSFADGATAFTGNSSGAPFSFYQINSNEGVVNYTADAFAEQAVTLTTTETAVAYSIIAPFEAASDKKHLKFKVYTTGKASAGQEVEVSLKGIDKTTAYAGSTQGKAFHIIFSFGVDDETIVGTASVTDWVFAGTTVVPMT